MSSILKVDQIQLADGSSASAVDYGLLSNGSVIQTVAMPVKQVAVSAPDHANNRNNVVSIGYTLSITTTQPNSKVLLLLSGSLTNSTGSHTYFDVKRDGVFLNNDSLDSLWADHASVNITSGFCLNYLDEPNKAANTTINYTFFVGDWGGGVVALNRYPINNNADGYSMFIAQEILNV